jgi:hypothetical protein
VRERERESKREDREVRVIGGFYLDLPGFDGPPEAEVNPNPDP